MSNDKIIKLIDDFENEVKAIKKEVLKICWYMRGGISYAAGMSLSAEDRNLIADIIDENLETTKKTNLPFF